MKLPQALLMVLAFILIISPISVLAQDEEKINYVALGDSLAAGVLSDNTRGIGYVGNISKQLESKGYEVNVGALGVSGATSQEVLNGVLTNKEALQNANIITISVGANDVIRGLDKSLLDGVDPELLNPDYQMELQKLTQQALAAELEAKRVAEAKIEETKPIVVAILTDVEAIQDSVNKLNRGLEPYQVTLPTNLKTVVNELDKEIQSVVSDIEEASNQFDLAIKNPNVNERETALESVAKMLETTAKKQSAVLEEIPELEVMLNEILIPLPMGIKLIPKQLKTQLTNSVKQSNDGATAVKDTKTAMTAVIKAENQIATVKEIGNKTAEMAQLLPDLNEKIQSVGDNMAQILDVIKEVNPEADVYVMGYYNALPYLSKEAQKITQPLLDGLNEAIQVSANQFGAVYVPTAELFDGNYEVYLPNPENIHPSAVGYEQLAESFMMEITKDYPEVISKGEAEQESIIPEEAEQGSTTPKQEEQEETKPKQEQQQTNPKKDEQDLISPNPVEQEPVTPVKSAEDPVLKESLRKDNGEPKSAKVEKSNGSIKQGEKINKKIEQGSELRQQKIESKGKDQMLPNTATNIYNWLFVGVGLLGIGIVALIIGRKRAKYNVD